MSVKAILVLCAQALLVQSALSQCTSGAAVVADPGLIAPAAYGAYGAGAYGMAGPYGLAGAYNLAGPYGAAAPCGLAGPALDFTPTSGGALPVSSASAFAPVGISVASDNVYEGILAAAGELPFVGTVAVEGVLPTAGAGAVNHACGNGVNAMAAADTAFAPGYAGAYGPAAAIASGYAGAYGPAAAIAPAAALAPFGAASLSAFGAAAIAPTAAIAPGLGYSAGLAGIGCGYAL